MCVIWLVFHLKLYILIELVSLNRYPWLPGDGARCSTEIEMKRMRYTANFVFLSV